MFTKTRFYPNFKSLGDIIDICDISYTYEGGGQIFFTHRGGQTFLHRGGGQTFFVGGGDGHEDVDEEMDVS